MGPANELAMLAFIKSEMDDAADLGRLLAAVGSFALERLGFVSDAPAELRIDIGDDDPGRMSILMSWPIPASKVAP